LGAWFGTYGSEISGEIWRARMVPLRRNKSLQCKTPLLFRFGLLIEVSPMLSAGRERDWPVAPFRADHCKTDLDAPKFLEKDIVIASFSKVNQAPHLAIFIGSIATTFV